MSKEWGQAIQKIMTVTIKFEYSEKPHNLKKKIFHLKFEATQ